jgi:hypothetical protein
MNEGLPPPVRPKGPNFYLMVVLGIVLIFVSCVLCSPARSPYPLGIGTAVAFVSIPFRGYRAIFIGFIGTIGAVLLCSAIVCGGMFMAQKAGNH